MARYQPRRKARRPRGRHPRRYVIQLRVSGAEYDALLEAAQAQELALGAFCRSAAIVGAMQVRHEVGVIGVDAEAS